MERFADFLIRHIRWFLGGLVGCTVAAVVYLAVVGLQFDANIENFFPQNDPTITQYRAFVDKYEADDGLLLIGFEHPDVFSYEVLRDIAVMTDSLERLPKVDRVASLTSFESLESGPEGVTTRRLVDQIVDDPEVLERQKLTVLDDSLAVGFVVNATADVTALLVTLAGARGENGYADRAVVLDGVERITDRYADRYTFRFSGIPFLRNTYVDALRVETMKYFVISSLLIVLILAWMFRSVRGVVMPLLVVYIGVLWTVGLMMVVGSAIDVLTSTLTAILLVVGVADSIHLLSKYYDALAEQYDRRYAIREMILRLGTATFLTSVTTAIGFATLATSQVVPMQRFGIFTAMGVFLTFVISVIFLAGVLLRTRLPNLKQTTRLTDGALTRALSHIDRFVAARPIPILAVSGVAVVVLILGAFQLRVNAYVNDDLGPGTQAYQDMMFFQDRLVAPFPLEILIQAPEADAFKDPDRLRQVATLERYLSNRPEVKRVASITDVLRQVNQVLHGDSTEYNRIPSSAALTAEYLFLLELTDPDLLERFVDFDYAEVRLSALMDDVGSFRMKQFIADLDSVVAVTLDSDLEVTKTGTTILAAGIADYLTESLLYSIGLAFIFISILMGVLFRNFKLAFIALVPNILPLILTAGLMGFLGIDIKPATAVIFSIAFGIAVDDTIHMLARLRQEIRRGIELRAAVRNSILGTGKAIVLTSVILLGGFSVLTTSAFQSSTYMGALVSTTIFAALVADLLLLPALIHALKPDVSSLRRKADVTQTPQ